MPALAESTQPLPPRNRHEKRLAARLARKASPSSSGARVVPLPSSSPVPDIPEQVSQNETPAGTPTEAPEAAPKKKSEPRSLEEEYLETWGRVRGPLFESPRVVVCRVLALTAALKIGRGGRGVGLRMRAMRVCEEAMREVPASKAPASGEAYARASAMMAEVMRLGRTLSWEDDLAGVLANYFAAERRKKDLDGEDFDHFRHYAWGELLCTLFLCTDDNLRLRAARSLLAWTRDDARKTGRRSPLPVPEGVAELLEEVRALAGRLGGGAVTEEACEVGQRARARAGARCGGGEGQGP